MKPYSRKSLEDEKHIFNYRLSRARRIIGKWLVICQCNDFGSLILLCLNQSVFVDTITQIFSNPISVCLKAFLERLLSDKCPQLSILFDFFVSQEARSEEHTSELQSHVRISYAVFCLKKKKNSIKSYSRTKSKQQNKYWHLVWSERRTAQ